MHLRRAQDLHARHWSPASIAREVARAARADGHAAEAETDDGYVSVTFFPSYATVELNRRGEWVEGRARQR